ncbi:MAG: lipopolysaccharide biosynthesis protein [Pleurocapsa sp.]
MTKHTAHKTSNDEQFFGTDRLKKELKQRSIRGGAVTILAQASKFILQMGSTIVLARLLLPEDYGLIGMVTVTIGFAQLFKDLGLANATVQKSEINHQQVSTLFWINFVISCLTAAVVAALAPVVSWFYQEPRLIGITIALASIFIFGGLTVQHQALLRRQMYFTSLAKIEIASTFCGVLTAIIAASYGLGYWALVLMQIVTTAGNALGVWLVCSWRPGKPAKGAGIKSMLAFGGNLTGFNIVNYFSRNLDNILIGRYWGSQQLGLYAKAYQLVLLPIQQINTPITNVALPALSSLQNEPEQYRRYYYRAILLISTLGMPLTAFLFASADKAILLMLGEQWLDVVPIFRYLMPAAFNATIGVGIGWVYQSLNLVNRLFLWGIVSSAINVILFSIGIRWGAIGVAAAYGLSRPLFLIAGFAYCYQGTVLKLSELATILSRPTAASFGAAIALMGINHILPEGLNNAIAFLIDTILYTLMYLGIWLILPRGRRTLLEMLQLVKTLKKKKPD